MGELKSLEKNEFKSAKAKSSIEGYENYLKMFPEGYDKVPLKFRMPILGPKNLTITDIINYKKGGLSSSLLIEKIHGADGKYKNFSLKEINWLKKRKISETMIKAMMKVTRRIEKEARNE